MLDDVQREDLKDNYAEWKKKHYSKKHNQIQTDFPGNNYPLSMLEILKTIRDNEEDKLQNYISGYCKGISMPNHMVNRIFTVIVKSALDKGYIGENQKGEIEITSHGLEFINQQDKTIFKLTI